MCIPYFENCRHVESGWCQKCVSALGRYVLSLENEAAQQGVQLTGGTLRDFQAIFCPEVLSGLEADTTPPTSN